MRFSTNRLLRRAPAWLAAAILSGLNPAWAQQDPGKMYFSDGSWCNYSTMSIAPNGAITVGCVPTKDSNPTDPNPPPSPDKADFWLSLPGSLTASPSAQVTVTINRTGGPAKLNYATYTLTGSGCANKSHRFPLSAGDTHDVVFTATSGGSCTVAVTPEFPDISSRSTVTITVGTGNPPPVAGCPTPAAGSIARSTDLSNPDKLFMGSGTIAYYPVPTQAASYVFTQNEIAAVPNDIVTEFSVSRCPGVIDSSVPQCYKNSGLVNYNSIDIITRPTNGWGDQASVGNRGCYADAASGTWYVNVRWTFPFCQYGTAGCGFSMKWNLGGWL